MFRGKEAYSDCLELCWSTPQPFGQLAAHHPFLTTCFTTAPFTQCFLSRASHPECIFSTSGLGGSRASHLHRISAMINPKHPSLLVTRRQKLARLHMAWLAVSRHKWLASLHQACRGQLQPTSTSDS